MTAAMPSLSSGPSTLLACFDDLASLSRAEPLARDLTRQVAALEEQLAAAAEIRAIPTLMAFKKGHLVFNQAGALPPAALDDLIAQVRAFDVDNAIGEQSSDRSDL